LGKDIERQALQSTENQRSPVYLYLLSADGITWVRSV